MPIIPVYNSRQTLQEGPGKADQFGGLAQSAGNISAGLYARSEELRHEAEDAQVMQLQNDFADRIQSYATDPDNGYMNLSGMGAAGATEKYGRAIDKSIAETLKGLDKSVAARVSPIFQQMARQARLEAAQFEANQVRSGKIAVLDANVSLNSSQYVKASLAGDWEQAAQFKTAMMDNIDKRYKGQGEDVILHAKLAATSDLHKSIAQGLPADRRAEYLTANKAEMLGQTYQGLMQEAEEQQRIAITQAHADRIMSMEQMTDAGRLEEARKLEDGPLRDAVVMRVKARNSEQAQLIAQQGRKNRQSAYNKVLNDRLTPDDLTVDERLSIGPQGEQLLWRSIEKRNMGLAPYSQQPNPEKHLLGMTRPDKDMAELSDVELEAAKADLTAAEWGQLKARRDGARAAIATMNNDPAMYGDIDGILTQYNSKIFGSDDPKDKVQANALRDGMYLFVQRHMDKTGGNPTPAEIRAEASRLSFDRWPGISGNPLAGPAIKDRDSPLESLGLADDDVSRQTGIPVDMLGPAKAYLAKHKVPVTIGNLDTLWRSRDAK